MTDITQTHHEAKLIDMMVAGYFTGKRYAFISIVTDDYPRQWQLAVIVAGKLGWYPLDQMTHKRFATRDDAQVWADGLNDHLGLSKDDINEIHDASIPLLRMVRDVP